MNPITCSVAVVAAAASMLAVGAVTADAAPRNPVTSPTSGKAGVCNVKKTQSFGGRDLVVADFGGGNPASPVYVVHRLHAAGVDDKDLPMALAVAYGESKLCPHARHYNRAKSGVIRSTDFGLYQVNTRWHPWAKRYDLDSVTGGTKAAARIYRGAGSWKPWHASSYADNYLPWAKQQVAKAGY